ncbi:hypothetical protein AUL38_14080 [Leucobacter sp. G161]|nr:hypothetical protein AUL38_14080 [Leucobacter sp. G161]
MGQIVTLVEEGNPLGFLPLFLIGLMLASGLTSALQQYVLQRVSESAVRETRHRLLHKIIRLPIAEYDTRPLGDLLSRVGNDTSMLRDSFFRCLHALFSGVLTIAGATVGMLIVDPVLFLVAAVTVLASLSLVVALGRLIRSASSEVQHTTGQLTDTADQALRGIRVLRAGNATAQIESKLFLIADAAWSAGIHLARVSTYIAPVSIIATQVAFIATLGLGGLRVANQSLTLAGFTTFLLFLFMLVSPLSQIFEAISSLNRALGSYGRIRAITELRSEPDLASSYEAANDRQKNCPQSAAPEGPENAIEFHKVSFQYVQRATDAESPQGFSGNQIDSISFIVPTGSRVAFVGPSGAGKSTILQLIVRLYEPTAGEITYFGTDHTSVSRVHVRQYISYVEQDVHLFSGTLRENLTIFTPEASDEACLKALEAVNLKPLVDRSGSGLDLEIGDDGVSLSGGERQRLAVARALLADRPIILLDESTANLDGRNEQFLRDSIDLLGAEKTLVVVAHRLSTVTNSDIIFVVDSGRIVARGTHQHLLRNNDLYRELASYQLLA